MIMRSGPVLVAIALCVKVPAQLAIGGFAGGSEDRLWQTELSHIGLFCDFRSKLVPSAVVRANAWFSPDRGRYSESYHSVHEPVEFTWLAQTYRERVRLAGVALDLKFPFENNACVDGYYKGTYLLAGCGFAQRWQTIDLWEQDRYGTVTSSHIEKTLFEPMLRAGFGGEWNFPWGGPFVEGVVTASAPGLGRPSIRFPGSAMLTIGYRYSFGKAEPMIEGE